MMLIKGLISKVLSNELKGIRKQRKLSQRKAAIISGIREAEWRSLERGKIKDPRLSTILRIAFNMGLSLNRIFGLSGKVHGQPPESDL